MANGTLIPVARQTYTDINGKLIPGAKLYSYLAGTTTPAPLYADSSLTVPLTNPAIADGSGRLTAYMPSNTTYKLELRTSTDVLVWIQDGVQGVPSNEADLDVVGIAGEPIADRNVVFLSNGTGGTTAGRWYLGDADIVARSTGANIIGIAPLGFATAGSGSIRLQGRVTGFSGLTPGAAYYISQVAGALTSVAPPNARFVGIADTTTSLVMSVAGIAQAQPADPIFNSVQISSTNASALDVAGGIVAGTGNVQVVNAAGNVLETAIADGTLLARVSSAETIAAPWVFTANPTLQSVTPQLSFNETDAAPNEKNWFLAASAGVFSLGATEDIPVSFPRVFEVTRSGVTPTGLTLFVPLAGTRINSHSAQPGFLAYNASFAAIPSGQSTLPLGSELYDNASNFSANTFTAPVTGLYEFGAHVDYASGSQTTTIVTTGGSFAVTISGTSAAGSILVPMTAGHTAFVRVQSAAGGNLNGGSSPYVTYFWGRLVP